MKSQARKGDIGRIRMAGSICAHNPEGPAISGSENVLVNGMPALRVGDVGVHSSRESTHEWIAAQGAPCVLINNRRAHRYKDRTFHCDSGTDSHGETVTGSRDVLVGDWQCEGQPISPPQWKTIIYFEFWGIPLDPNPIQILFDDGSTERRVLEQGRVIVEHPGKQILRVDILRRE